MFCSKLLLEIIAAYICLLVCVVICTKETLLLTNKELGLNQQTSGLIIAYNALVSPQISKLSRININPYASCTEFIGWALMMILQNRIQVVLNLLPTSKLWWNFPGLLWTGSEVLTASLQSHDITGSSNQPTFTAICSVHLLWHVCPNPIFTFSFWQSQPILNNGFTYNRSSHFMVATKMVVKLGRSCGWSILWLSWLTTLMGRLHYSCKSRMTCKRPYCKNIFTLKEEHGAW